ncbi:hypothetical protein [Sinorhizobium sp. BG8]|uniref:hypothetical protein n=1 Tax=Sinorhizobium sp. BG8 TaxID=2613773 RepID=UPI00193EB106|nr:hypothetical protein [Sinorhizobium sp. BG8]QRM57468.1 hypothetical protein F3Y30_23555 [Sinorhizobium sp. BG8]
MTRARKFKIALFAGIVALLSLEAGEKLQIPGVDIFVGTAEARVGRPLTPVSVAGVARRTARRCAVGVYYC